MLNKLMRFIREYGLIEKGDSITCAVSGGADSVALLFALYLLRDKLGIYLQAAHFNHGLRGAESDRDEDFVRQLCHRYDIELSVGAGNVTPGKKGLEAAARDARYAFLNTLPGKIATAHTADDNAETVLMHLVRGTGLKGLGGIAPMNGKLIRPMLSVTRRDVLAFLEEYHLDYVTDSSNETDDFLRNRLRHKIMPILKKENPRFSENTSETALRLRQDECVLSELAKATSTEVSQLRQLPEALQFRKYADFLEQSGVPEPEAEHLKLLHKLVMSDNPSAKASFPGGVLICRNYDKLEKVSLCHRTEPKSLTCPGEVLYSNFKISCCQAGEIENSSECFSVLPKGQMVVRSREPGDSIRLSAGTTSLKKLFSDKKIPANCRDTIPVIADDEGVIAVGGIGANLDRLTWQLPAVSITMKEIKE